MQYKYAMHFNACVIGEHTFIKLFRARRLVLRSEVELVSRKKSIQLNWHYNLKKDDEHDKLSNTT